LLASPDVQNLLGITIAIPPGMLDGDEGQSGDPNAPQVTDTESPPAEQPTQTEDTDPAAALYPVANLALRRALALAGSRLVPHRQRDRYPGCAKHALHVRHGSVDRARADAVLAGAWDDLHAVADDLMVDASDLRDLLHGFAAELLVRGMAYDPALLREVITRATFSRPPAAVGAG
jgi:hypothetical protein